jgi:hypothetical protein
MLDASSEYIRVSDSRLVKRTFNDLASFKRSSYSEVHEDMDKHELKRISSSVNFIFQMYAEFKKYAKNLFSEIE